VVDVRGAGRASRQLPNRVPSAHHGGYKRPPPTAASSPEELPMKWKPDWAQAKERFTRWWAREGLAARVTCPRAEPAEGIGRPPAPDNVRDAWTDPAYRCRHGEWQNAQHHFLAEAFPYFDTQIGPGSLGTFLGAEPHFDQSTVWYDPCIEDPDACGPIRFEAAGNRWLDAHLALIDEGLRRARGRYLVGIPDLIENLDTLAALRGNERILYDLIERPAWVSARLEEINRAYFAAFDLLYEKVRDADGGNCFSAFRIWGPGKTAKVQCDISCMISPEMFRRFVVPPLTEQCAWLDYSLYHLDGTTAVQHVDALLEIEPLNAVQWTPQAGLPGGGDPTWYDLYRRVLDGGKGVHVGARPEQVVPLLDALGGRGVYVLTAAPDLESAHRLIEKIDQYR
jgi:hypothetical protein